MVYVPSVIFTILKRNEKHYGSDQVVALTYFQKLYFTD